MGKKVKKKAARNAQKEKQFPTTSPKAVSQEIVPATDTVTPGISVIKDQRTCPHLEKGINLEKFSSKLSSLESHKCEDCREGVADKRTKKGKNKHGSNKVSNSKSKSDSASMWVCLDCGHFSCGGLGLPATPQTHAVRHAKQYEHPIVFKLKNPNLRWCFFCNTIIPVSTSNQNGEQKDILSEFVNILKTRSQSSETREDVEDIWFGSGSVITEVKSVNTLQNWSENMVKGLTNLGNTCFFNSVMQNLLSMDKLQDYFLKLEGPVGPLTVSLKKLFVETGSSTGARNVINPRSFFSCLCAKAPQFKGFQQHDSHELLRCLLDGLCTEESRIQKRYQDGNNLLKNGPTFVDTIFGGQISSTVSCLECGHASVVYEPYLDLSLPLPNKKTPSKKISSVSRSKKTKFAPKKSKFRSKSKNSSDFTGPLKPIESCGEKNDMLCDLTESDTVVVDPIGDEPEQIRDFMGISSDNLVQSDYVEPKDSVSISNVSSLDNGGPVIGSNGHVTVSEQVDFIDSEETSWLDYLTQDASSQNKDLSVQDISIQDSGNSNDVLWEDDEPLLKVQESEVLLLPYKEITSTSEQEPSDFDGFGGLFDEPEPEPVYGPAVGPVSNGVEESECDDSDEVDDTDSPVSVEKCLAYFTKPELLTKNEHAWHCENCSKSLLEQKTRINNKLKKLVLNGGNNVISTASPVSGTEHVLSNGFLNHKNPSTESAVFDDSDEILVLHNEKSDSCQDNESCSVNGPTDNHKSENVDQHVDQKESEIPVRQNESEIPVRQNVDQHVDQKESEIPVRQNESESSSDDDDVDDEVDSKSVKVARDASKRILISRAPPILTIHLKRFCQDARGRLSKLNGHVNFRDTIDLKPYMDPSCCKDRETYKYKLIGVVEHLGTMRGGHYVAYVQGGNKKGSLGIKENKNPVWYHASDAYVREVSFEEVLRCEAYILFYQEM